MSWVNETQRSLISSSYFCSQILIIMNAPTISTVSLTGPELKSLASSSSLPADLLLLYCLIDGEVTLSSVQLLLLVLLMFPIQKVGISIRAKFAIRFHKCVSSMFYLVYRPMWTGRPIRRSRLNSILVTMKRSILSMNS